MTWNYRLIKDLSNHGLIGIYEVYYEDGVPGSWTAEAVTLDRFESSDEVRRELSLIAGALNSPLLHVGHDGTLIESVTLAEPVTREYSDDQEFGYDLSLEERIPLDAYDDIDTGE